MVNQFERKFEIFVMFSKVSELKFLKETSKEKSLMFEK